jgi:hypothetical protein
MANEKKTNKMIQVKIYFWTNGMVPQKGGVLAKHAWDCGHVVLPANPKHHIRAGGRKQFRTLLQLGSAIEELLQKNGVTVHMGRGSRKYMSAEIPNSKLAN